MKGFMKSKNLKSARPFLNEFFFHANDTSSPKKSCFQISVKTGQNVWIH